MDIFLGIIVILFAHFVADFVFQPHYIASTKSYSISALIQHIIIYALSFYIIFGIAWYPLYYLMEIKIAAQVWLQLTIGITVVNSLLHYFIDFFTSKITKYFWDKKDYHNFFVVIGFDQLLHLSLLVFSYAQMLNNFQYI